ncbi:MAG: PHP domain-containing protein [Myxococcota bacterium]
MPLCLQEDLHVHSTFSDGRSTLAENVERAAELGLRRLGCVDHVRRDTPWVREFARSVDALRRAGGPRLIVGVEAKLLDGFGTLDVPDDLTGVERIYVADHQFPLNGHCFPPRVIRDMLADGTVTADTLVESLVSATIRSIGRYPRVVLAHLFSILPKVGLSESLLTSQQLIRMSTVARMHGAWLEVDERWRCPGPRIVAYFRHLGVPTVASTDSHMAKRIGCFDYVAELARHLEIAA